MKVFLFDGDKKEDLYLAKLAMRQIQTLLMCWDAYFPEQKTLGD